MQTDQQDRARDNVRIAEAMGWTCVRQSMNSGNHFGRKPDAHKGGFDLRIPDYFNDANAALSICEFMRGKGYSADIQWYAHHSWRTQFYHPEKYYPDSYVDGTGDTLAQAICTAFIAFLDARKEGL